MEPTAVSNYGVQNKPAWPQMTGGVQPGGIPPAIPSNVFHPHPQAPIASQSKMAGDPWDWGHDNNLDNGNDAWNWSVDQAQEAQMQQHSVPNYPTLRPTSQAPAQDNYYNNSNGNNRPLAPPQQLMPAADGNIARTSSRESTPNLPQDSYLHYSNYGVKQAPSLQSPPPAISDTHPPPASSSLHNANSNQAQWRQIMQTPRSLGAFDATNQNSGFHHPQQQLQQPQVDTYNWDRVEKSNASGQETWQNQIQPTTASPQTPYWQNSSTEDNSSKTVNNQWMKVAQQSDSSQFNSPNNSLIQEPEDSTRPESTGPPSAPPQWLDMNKKKQYLNSQHPASHNPTPNEVTQQASQGNQGWHPSDVIPNKLTDNPPQEVNKFVAPEWHYTEHSSMHFSPPQATDSGAVTETQGPSLPPVPKLNNVRLSSFSQGAGTSESPFFNNSVVEPRRNSTCDRMGDLSSSINQMNLNEAHEFSSPQMEVQQPHFQEIHTANHRSSQLSQASAQPQSFPEADKAIGTTQEVHELQQPQALTSQMQQTGLTSPPRPREPMPKAYPSLQTQPLSPLDTNFRANIPMPPAAISQTIQEHDLLPPQQINTQNQNISHEGNCQPTNYDQWYNHTAAQTSQVPAVSQTTRYPEEAHVLSQKHWTPPPVSTHPEPSIDTCETVQPPAEFNSAATPEESRTFEVHATPTPYPLHFQQPVEQEPQQPPENYEFASNDRNTFLETGELTDSHHDQESPAPSQDDDNDDVPNDIPFLREVPGQSSNSELSRNDPTGQEEYTASPGTERRDVPPGQERRESGGPIRVDPDPLERRNDPSGRERSLPPVRPRNDPSGEERMTPLQQIPNVHLEPNDIRQVTGSGTNNNTAADSDLLSIDSGARQIPGGISPIDATLTAPMKPDDRNDRVVTGSQEYSSISSVMNMQETREEAVGASTRDDTAIATGSPKRRDSYEDGDDEESGNSRDESRERRDRRDLRDSSPPPLENRRRYDRNYYEPDRDREFDDDYYYDRRRPDYDRPYNSREDLDRRDTSYRSGDRGHRVEEADDAGRRGKARGEEERDGRTVGKCKLFK